MEALGRGILGHWSWGYQDTPVLEKERSQVKLDFHFFSTCCVLSTLN